MSSLNKSSLGCACFCERKRLRQNVLCRLAQAERNTARKSSWSPWHTRFTRRMLAPRRPRCYPSDASAVGKTRLQRLAQRAGRKSPTSFSASAATKIVGRTMFASATGAHGQAGSESTPSRSLCSAVFARTPTGVFCFTQPPPEPKDSLEPNTKRQKKNVKPMKHVRWQDHGAWSQNAANWSRDLQQRLLELETARTLKLVTALAPGST